MFCPDRTALRGPPRVLSAPNWLVDKEKKIPPSLALKRPHLLHIYFTALVAYSREGEKRGKKENRKEERKVHHVHIRSLVLYPVVTNPRFLPLFILPCPGGFPYVSIYVWFLPRCEREGLEGINPTYPQLPVSPCAWPCTCCSWAWHIPPLSLR